MDLDDDFAFADAPDIVKQMEEAKKKDATTARPKRKAGGKKPEMKTCFVNGCSLACQKSKRWCEDHNKKYDNMYYQAKRDGEISTLEAAVKDSVSAQKAMELFEEDNPSDGKWRRKVLIQWTKWKRIFVYSVIQRNRDGCKPFEYGQWLIHCSSVMGWSKDAAKDEWEKHEKDASLKRDKKGLNGCDRIWIPVIEEEHRDRDKARSSILEESSAAEKDLSKEDRSVLVKHVKSNLRAGDHQGFFKDGEADSEEDQDMPLATPKKRPAEDDKDKETPAEKKARVKYERLSKGPFFLAFKTAASEKIKEKLASVSTMAATTKGKLDEAYTQVEAARAAAAASDPVLESYASCVSACREVLTTWETEVSIPDTLTEACAKEVHNVRESLASSVRSVGQDIKLVKGDSVLEPKAYFNLHAVDILKYHSALEASEKQKELLKVSFPVVELFFKSIMKISTDVGNYLKQKESSRARAEQKRRGRQTKLSWTR